MDNISNIHVIIISLLIIIIGVGLFTGWKYSKNLKANFKESSMELQNRIENLQTQNTNLQKKLARKTQQLKNQEQKTRELVKTLETKIKKSKVESRKGIVTVTIPNRIIFKEASAKLSDTSLEVLRTISKTLKDHKNREIRVQGHTDTYPMHPEGTYQSNWELSAHRAVNVVKYLVYARGIDRTRIGAVAFGQFKPSDRSEGKPKNNRRVEIVLYPDRVVD